MWCREILYTKIYIYTYILLAVFIYKRVCNTSNKVHDRLRVLAPTGIPMSLHIML